MKTLLSLLVLSGLLSLRLLAQPSNTPAPVKIQASEAKQYVGKESIVSGKVAEVNQTEKLVRLNLDKPYPAQSFTVVVFGAKTNLFPGLSQLKGKTIEVSGKIAEFKGRPELVLNTTNQLKVVDAPAEPSDKTTK